jgi:hypothetical protein
MSNKVRIAYPRTSKTIRLAIAKNGDRMFLAFGRTSGEVDSVAGQLLQADGKTPVPGVIPQTLLQPSIHRGPFWIIQFLKVPDPAKAKGTYTLGVYDSKKVLLGESSGLKAVDGQKKAGIVVVYPPAGDDVCTYFTAYGTITDPGTVECDLIVGSTTIQGSTTVDNSAGTWWSGFTNVPEDVYNLTATLTPTMGDPVSDKSSTDITVSDVYCGSLS